MLSTLHQFLSEKREASLWDRPKESTRYEIISRIYLLLDKLTEEQKLILLQQLLRDKTVDFIFKLIVDLSDNQRLVLMKQLEEITARRRARQILLFGRRQPYLSYFVPP